MQPGRRTSRTQPPAPATRQRRSLCVVSPRLADLVPFVGGWVCDQALAGWDVTVLSSGGQQPDAVRILGGTGVDLDEGTAASWSLRADLVAVHEEIYRVDGTIRGIVCAADPDEVVLWGAGGVPYLPSGAARAFKAEALAALGAPVPGDSLEVLRTSGHLCRAAGPRSDVGAWHR